jgi:hypothetical protein
VALQPQAIPHFPLPDEEQAIALQIASDYLTKAGTQAATFLLGCPPLNGESALLAEFSNTLLRGATLCAELVTFLDDDTRM